MSDVNIQTFSGKVNVSNNFTVGSGHLFVDTQDNKVGLNTATPNSSLHVNGNAYIATDISFGGILSGNGSGLTNVGSGPWSSGTGNVYLSTSTDNVGIGTSSPLTPLHISSTNEITTSPAGSAVSQMRYGSTNSTVLFGVSSTAGHISAYDTSSFGTNRNLCFNADGGNVGIGKTAPLIDFDVGGNGENTRIGRSTTGSVHGADKRNQVRIGRFDQYESIGDQGFLGMRLMVDTANNLNLSGEADNQTAIQFYTWGNNIANSREVMRINSLGNVGIGTATPNGKLHIYVDSADGNTTDNALIIGGPTDCTGNTNLRIGCHNDYAWLQSHCGEPLNLNPLGNNVGIGMTNPSYKLHVNGDIAVPGGNSLLIGTNSVADNYHSGINWHVTNNSYYIRRTPGGWNSPNYQQLELNWVTGIILNAGNGTYGRSYVGVNDRMSIGSGYYSTYKPPDNGLIVEGQVGIGYNLPGSADKLAVNGRTWTVGLYNASDDRIKYNETDIPNSLDLVNQLKPKKYDKISTFPSNLEGHWIPTDEEWENVKESYNHLPEFGFIAQDVRKIPELGFLVSGDEMRVTQKDISLDEYNELASTERDTYTPIYVHSTDKTRISSEEYTRISIKERGSYNLNYTKRIESQTPLSVDYLSLSVLTTSALQEVDRQLQAEKQKTANLEPMVASLLTRITKLEQKVLELEGERYEQNKKIELLEMSHAALIQRIQALENM